MKKETKEALEKVKKIAKNTPWKSVDVDKFIDEVKGREKE